MEFNSRFNPLDKVYLIHQDYARKFVRCERCGGTGELYNKSGLSFRCNECWGAKGKNVPQAMQWQVDNPCSPLTIGEIRIAYTAEQPGIDPAFGNMGPQEESKKEVYMCVETGIGSGRLYDGDDLFLSLGAAEDECRERNEWERQQEIMNSPAMVQSITARAEAAVEA